MLLPFASHLFLAPRLVLLNARTNLIWVATVMALSCSGDSGVGPEPITSSTAELTNPTAAVAPVATTQTVDVRVTRKSAAVAGATVTFRVDKGGGSVVPSTAVTNALGFASATWTLGTTVGENVLAINADGTALAAIVTSVPGPANRVSVAPSLLRLGTGDEAPLDVKAFDQYDNLISNASFTWTTSNAAIAFLDGARVRAGTRGTARVTVSAGSGQSYADVIVVGESVDRILARCPTAEEIAALRATLNITFEGDPTAGTLTCTIAGGSQDLTLLQQRAYQALLAMREIQFSQALPWTTDQVYDWLTGAITGIRFRTDIELSFCCEPARVINIQTLNLGTIQSVISTDVEWLILLAGLYIHEARHAEGYPHTCGASDQTLAEMGAWAVQYYWELWTAEKSDPVLFRSQAGRDFLKSAADGTRQSRFCSG